jgi:P27 family predicted phage terminase small subunit
MEEVMPRKKSKEKSSKSDQQSQAPSCPETPPVPIIECPTELGEVARQEWDRIIPLLAAADRLSQLDRGLLAIYCNAYAAWLGAVAALQQFGTMMKSPNGYPIQSPYVSVASKNAEIMIRVGAEFGFSPASRMRLPNPSKDPLLLELTHISELASELKPL